jgi:hypothetical protein
MFRAVEKTSIKSSEAAEILQLNSSLIRHKLDAAITIATVIPSLFE